MDEKRKTLDLPWTTIIAAAAAIGGVYFYLNPLETSRPPERTGFSVPHEQQQDVDARLWQDPLRATLAHEEKVRQLKKDWSEDYDRENLRHSESPLKPYNAPAPDWVLMVMIPSGSYAEYSEIRLRMRVAVLEALGGEGFVPDGEHIGYWKYSGAHGADKFLPYEWCKRDFTIFARFSGQHPRADRALVLWLPEADFQQEPITALDALITRTLGIDSSKVPVRIIGPRTSTTLRAMVEELDKIAPKTHLLTHVQMWSATASAVDELMLYGTDAAKRGCTSVEALFRDKLGGAQSSENFQFFRLTFTDDVVIKELLKELALRGVDTGSQNSTDRIVLVSEWDTPYGRALPLTFEWEVDGGCPEQLKAILEEGHRPANVRVFHYLRGLDGRVPIESASTETPASKTPTEKSPDKPREKPEGLDQADYLRRLARELEALNQKFLARDGGQIRAVGVLGSDVYAKLLVLEGVRPALPEAIFFTTDLDARFGHPDEWRWARNLVVASTFGPTIRDNRVLASSTQEQLGGASRKSPLIPSPGRDHVLPFRDRNQTAVYCATLAAARSGRRERSAEEWRNKKREMLAPVRLYEIGRNGPFDLTNVKPLRLAHTLQPENTDLRDWLSQTRVFRFLSIGLLIAGGIIWIIFVILGGRRPSEGDEGTRQKRWTCWEWVLEHFRKDDSAVVSFLTSSWAMFGLIGVLSFLIVFGIARLPSLLGALLLDCGRQYLARGNVSSVRFSVRRFLCNENVSGCRSESQQTEKGLWIQ
jgi:hypothetical protein